MVFTIKEAAMQEMFGDLWEFHSLPGAFACITTNGTVRKDGRCVMGRGCARQARDRWVGLDKRLGSAVQSGGNHIHPLGDRLYSFPVKHSWWEPADLELIKRSASELNAIAQAHPDNLFYLPRPGCGNGQLQWEQVRPLLTHLPHNVIIIDHEPPLSHPQHLYGS